MQRPAALGLMLCDQVIVERETGKPTLVGVFTALACSQFPSTPRPFDVFAALTDGQGHVALDLVVSEIETEEQLSAQSLEQDFPDPLQVVNVRFRFRALSFPAAGNYLFELLAEGESICHRRLVVRLSEDQT
jgi:hypothetical protein